MVVLPPLVAIAALSVYFILPLLRVPLWRRIPWEFLAVIAGAGVFSVYELVRTPTLGAGVGAVVTLGVLGFALWFFLSFSMYGPREDRPRVGERFPDFDLPASDGSNFRLADARGRRLLVMCYRGDW
jgi:hypothetical protein